MLLLLLLGSGSVFTAAVVLIGNMCMAGNFYGTPRDGILMRLAPFLGCLSQNGNLEKFLETNYYLFNKSFFSLGRNYVSLNVFGNSCCKINDSLVIE